MIKIGSNDISKVYIGDGEIAKGFVGDDLVYQNEIDYSKEYFTVEAISAGTISWNASNVEYSLNGGAWTAWTGSALLQQGDKMKLRGLNDRYSTGNYNRNPITGSDYFKIYGNMMSLIYGANFVGEESFTNTYVFCNLFYNSGKLYSIDNLVLPATGLTNYCYQRMFYGCGNLQGVDSLILPATALTNGCYQEMFYGCTSITTAPTLPATTLASSCYQSMFYNCTTLTSAPSLPATNLQTTCYYEMFRGCTSLTTAPVLPATNLKNGCYQKMFYNCTSLTEAPALPGTAMQSNCYNEMFAYCTSLVTAPALNSTNLQTSCYQGMFHNCTNLVNAPALPATGLRDNCYDHMFQYCSNLETAPELPATAIPKGAYYYMFANCPKLNYIKSMATDITTNSATTTSWVDGVAATGMFIQSNDMDDWTIGKDGIPVGWQVQGGYNVKYFSIEAEEATTLSWNVSDVEYSTDDGTTWAAWTGSTALAQNDVALFRSTGNTTYSGKTISSTGDIVAYGNIMSLFYGDNFYGQTTFPTSNGYEFRGLFKNCTNLLNAQRLKFPATTLDTYCYANMFEGCTSLTTVPKLLATTLANYCYYGMFMNCTGLISGPALPATTLADSCYSAMFMDCTALTSAPELPATTMQQNCYSYMFNGCTSLSSAPTLNSTTLAYGCYSYMFQNAGLTSAPELPATTLADYCYCRMFENCTGLTSAPKIFATTTANYSNFSMFKGCTALVKSPVLKAATLANNCYGQMFSGCSSMSEITCVATDISATDCTLNWVDGVSGSGVFRKDVNMSSWTTGNNGIPVGWTVEDWIDYESMYLTVEMLDADTIHWAISNLQYSLNDGAWTTFNNTTGLAVSQGDKIRFKTTTKNNKDKPISTTSAKFNLYGNIMSIGYGDDFYGQTVAEVGQFQGLFNYSNVVDARNLKLPATVLKKSSWNGSYVNMFGDCPELVYGPSELPKFIIQGSGYYCMAGMFQGCTKLISVFEKFETDDSISQYSCERMFSGCTSLTIAPKIILLTQQTQNGSIHSLFRGCSSLDHIEYLGPEPYSITVNNWVDGVAANGTFVKSVGVNWRTGVSGIPDNWAVQDV